MTNDLRLIEDYLPIEAISKEASREKSVRKGHISTLHLWWARRPLVACRAAVYGALVPADRWVKDVEIKNPPADQSMVLAMKNGTKRGLNRKAAKDFVTKLCRHPKTDPTSPADIKIKNETEAAIVEAQKHILHAHADRLTAELAEAKNSDKPPAWVAEFKFKGEKVTYDDIIAGRAPRPRVLDMFAGGGAIPLEALRLGCEAYALDLNPVAHIIQLCTLVYPQMYGKPDPSARGMTGPKNAKGETSWGGLAAEVRYWGDWVLDYVRKEIGDLYPPIPDLAVWDIPPEIAFDRDTGRWNTTKPGKPKRGVKLEALAAVSAKDSKMFESAEDDNDGESSSESIQVPPGFLQPVAYLWTRTVRCKNPGCGATVPLVRQTWLCKKEPKKNTLGCYLALEVKAAKKAKRVSFGMSESASEEGLGFDPSAFSNAGNSTCPFCGAVADNDYVKEQGKLQRIGADPMAIVCRRPNAQGRVYLAAEDLAESQCIDNSQIQQRIAKLSKRSGLTVPDEPVVTDAKNANFCILYGLDQFGKLFSPRQMLAMLTFVDATRRAHESQIADRNLVAAEHAKAVASMLACYVDRAADHWSSLCAWNPVGEKLQHTFGRQAIPMVWDYSEAHPWGGSVGDWTAIVLNAENAIGAGIATGARPATVVRGTAVSQPWPVESLDAVITDPPYYDNVPYADISDFFYVWLRRTIGSLYPEHFATPGTPKKQEAVADATRHGGDKPKAMKAYERMMGESLAEAARTLKPGGVLTVVYAHKTTLGWSTLVDAMRLAGFVVSEAWPLDTENRTRLRGMDSAALASSIFLIAHKRNMGSGTGNYEDGVQPELGQIVRERVDTLWEMGIAGADLVIACVGAGLRAFTKYDRVEYANGEEVPAEKFLAEVEGVVLDAMMGKLLGASGGNVSSIDPASRFYVLWRFVYKTAEIDAGEAIVFTYSQHVELDGSQGLSGDANALVEKKKAKYRTRDFTERGQNEKLGLPTAAGQPAPLVDQLHRTLWLMENSPRKLGEFIDEAKPDRERLRVLAQALAGAALSGKSDADAGKLVSTTTTEQSALGKLLANWRNLVENRMVAEEKTLFGTTR